MTILQNYVNPRLIKCLTFSTYFLIRFRVHLVEERFYGAGCVVQVHALQNEERRGYIFGHMIIVKNRIRFQKYNYIENYYSVYFLFIWYMLIPIIQISL